MSPVDPPAHLSEEDILALVAARLGHGPGAGAELGVGDDAAVLAVGNEKLAVTTDIMVEGVHFDLGYATAHDVGRRVMAANLSDLAAMGAVPAWGFLSLGLPPGPTAEMVHGLMDGLEELGRAHGLRLVGGDTVRSPVLLLNLCLVGRMEGVAPLPRSTARPGQAVCVSGPLGSSGAGLAWLLKGRDPADPLAAEAVEAHLRPVPRVALGRALAACGLVGAMMDISDGLALDLPRMCRASGVGARLETAKLPIAEPVREMALRLGADAEVWALGGGEDFELLFTCATGDVARIRELAAEADPTARISRVGVINKGKGVSLLAPDGTISQVGAMGYDHFRENPD